MSTRRGVPTVWGRAVVGVTTLALLAACAPHPGTPGPQDDTFPLAGPLEPTTFPIDDVPDVPMILERVLDVRSAGAEGPWYVTVELDKTGYADASEKLRAGGFELVGTESTDPFEARGVFRGDEFLVELTVDNPTGGGFLAMYEISRG